MLIRTTVALTVAVAIILLAGLLALVNGSLTVQRFRALEQDNITEQSARLRDSLAQDVENLSVKIQDWSNWDDCWKFVAGENPTFPATQISDGAFTGNHLDLMLFLGLDGHLVYRVVPTSTEPSLARTPELAERVLATAALRPTAAKAQPVAGLLRVGAGLVLYVARPILPLNGNGASHGTLVWARDLDREEQDTLAKRIHSTVDLRLLHEQRAIPQELNQDETFVRADGLIAQRQRLDDCLGQPVAVAEVAIPRSIWQAGMTTLAWQVVSTGVLMLLIGVGWLWLLERQVIGRLISLSNQVHQAELQAQPITVVGMDEIADLAHAVERLRLTLAKTRDEALLLARTKADFLAVMSHEIRTPLNGVIGMSGLLARTKLNQEQDEYTTIIRSSADNLLLLLNDILDFSKIEAGKIELEQTPFSLTEALGDAVTLLAEKAQSKHVELVLVFAPDLPVSMIGDPGRLRQIIINLVSNAVKFTERGQVVVRVGARHIEAQLWLDIAVEDSGIGMDEATAARLFKAFIQADASTTRRFGGTGLGLAISKRLVELMGGDLVVTSVPNQGSVFRFSIRVQADPGAPVMTPPVPTGASVLIAVAAGPLAEWLVELVRSWGGTPQVVVDYAELLIATASPRPEVIILDRDLPGFQALPEADPFEPIRTAWPQIPTVVLAPLYRCEAITGTVVLTKPVRPDRLNAAIVDAREGRLSQPENVLAPVMRFSGRVLVVDDHPINRRLACVLLERMGITVLMAENGSAALDRLATTPVDAVLMDCQMPVMDGFTATTELRRRERGTEQHVLVIALTANAFSEDRERCLSAGMDDFLTKPLREGDLQRILTGHLTTVLAPAEGSVPASTVGDTPAEAAGKIMEEAPAPAAIDAVTRTMLSGLPGDIDDLNLFEELSRIFVAEFEGRFENLVSALMAEDVTTSCQQAHALKGSSMTLGFQELGQAMQEIEHAAHQGDVATGVELITTVQEAWVRVQTALAQPAASP